RTELSCAHKLILSNGPMASVSRSWPVNFQSTYVILMLSLMPAWSTRERMPTTMALHRMTAHEFAQRLKLLSDEQPDSTRFTLFLGAGCSVSSGILIAGHLLHER